MVRKIKKKEKPIRNRQRFTIADVVIYTVLGLVTLTMIIPFLNIIAISLSDYASAVKDKSMLLPKNLNFSAYGILFNVEVYRAIAVTAFVVVTNTVLHILLCMMAAYPLSKKELPGRQLMLLYVLFAILFNGGTIPFYILINKTLGLSDSLLVYILPGVVNAYTVILMKNFIKQIPDSLEEAAFIDGASYVGIFFKVIMPLSKPIIATMALFNGVGVWNNWFSAVLFIKNKKLFLIQNVLREMLIENNMGSLGHANLDKSYDVSVKMAAIIIAIIPVVIIYPMIQKYFIKGMFVGSVKG